MIKIRFSTDSGKNWTLISHDEYTGHMAAGLSPTSIIQFIDEGKRPHREDGGPAITYGNGRKEWKEHGVFKNVGDPLAPTMVDGENNHYFHRFGVLHSATEPSVIRKDGSKEYYWMGSKGRPDDLPSVELVNGTKMWYESDKISRPGGKPAILHKTGTSEYLEGGLRHRVDGPALENQDPRKDKYYLFGVQYSKEEHANMVKEMRAVGMLHVPF